MNDYSAPNSTRAEAGRIDAEIGPQGALAVLSQSEVNELCESGYGALYETFRRCSLAVLNAGSYVDDAKAVFEQYSDFTVRLIRQQRGIRLQISNAPAYAFVGGKMIKGVQEHLFSVLRDILYVTNEIERSGRFDLTTSSGITDAVFNILRNADVMELKAHPNLVVCWGGHSIGRDEYDYTKEVGYQFGLHGFNVCTGCGPGAMKGPMKGAAVGHAKQRSRNARYIGITEPGIIAAEAPNPIVNQLVIMPDIEKRLEAFVRLAHGIVVFPGGAGTAEEVLYLLGILMHPENADIPYPVILTAPRGSADYFTKLLAFIDATLGEQARACLQVIIDDPAAVAAAVGEGMGAVEQFRRERNDAMFFNWMLSMGYDSQMPFAVDHNSMMTLDLNSGQPPHKLAVSLRRAFSGIVAGNVKEEGIRAVEQYGPFRIRGAREVVQPMDELLSGFVAQQRMRLPGTAYQPCYQLVDD